MKKSKMTAVIVAMCILLTSIAGTITASAEVKNFQNKLSPQLIEEINTPTEVMIGVYISLLPCTSEVEIEKLVSEKYTWSNDDEYLKYYRQELSNVIGAYVQQFVDNNAALLYNILVQPNSAEFVVAEVSKDNVNELAKLDIVRDIDIWNDTIDVISEDETDDSYLSKISEELSAKMNASDSVPVYISLKSCTSESEIEKLVSEKYTWTTEDEHLKYYRQELSSIVGAYVQKFVDEHDNLLNKIIVQPNSTEFVIAEVSKGNVEELAKIDIVRDIDYWSNEIDVISEEPDDSYLLKISEELSAKMNGADSIPVYISLNPCTSEAEIEKLVSEKYTWATEDEHLKYYRQELSSVVGVYVQQFIDNNFELLGDVIIQPNSAEFVIAKTTKECIIDLAKLNIVHDIDYWDDIVVPTADEESDNIYRNAFVEWSISKYGKKCLEDGYSYKELYRHVADNQTDWALVNAKYLLPEPSVETWVHIGGRNIMCGSLCAPFKCGYGIYDVKENCFYDLDELSDNYSKYNGLMETLEALKIGNMTGDANLDSTVSISDVTCIQRRIAELHQFNSYQNGLSDINKDGEVTISDATEIQRYLAQLITDLG